MGKVIPDRRVKTPPKNKVRVVFHTGHNFTGEVDNPTAFAADVLNNGYTESRPDGLRIWPASAIAYVDILSA